MANPPKMPGNWETHRLTQQEKDFAGEALEAHNRLRKRHGVQPLKHNCRMTRFALSYAHHLAKEEILEHREDNPYGENIYYSWSSDPNEELNGAIPVRNWYDEHMLYKWYGKEPPLKEIERVGHFTQMIWKDTDEIGIGCAKGPNGAYYVVCNYSPKGNWLDEFSANVLPLKKAASSASLISSESTEDGKKIVKKPDPVTSVREKGAVKKSPSANKQPTKTASKDKQPAKTASTDKLSGKKASAEKLPTKTASKDKQAVPTPVVTSASIKKNGTDVGPKKSGSAPGLKKSGDLSSAAGAKQPPPKDSSKVGKTSVHSMASDDSVVTRTTKNVRAKVNDKRPASAKKSVTPADAPKKGGSKTSVGKGAPPAPPPKKSADALPKKGPEPKKSAEAPKKGPEPKKSMDAPKKAAEPPKKADSGKKGTSKSSEVLGKKGSKTMTTPPSKKGSTDKLGAKTSKNALSKKASTDVAAKKGSKDNLSKKGPGDSGAKTVIPDSKKSATGLKKSAEGMKKAPDMKKSAEVKKSADGLKKSASGLKKSASGMKKSASGVLKKASGPDVKKGPDMKKGPEAKAPEAKKAPDAKKSTTSDVKGTPSKDAKKSAVAPPPPKKTDKTPSKGATDSKKSVKGDMPKVDAKSLSKTDKKGGRGGAMIAETGNLNKSQVVNTNTDPNSNAATVEVPAESLKKGIAIVVTYPDDTQDAKEGKDGENPRSKRGGESVKLGSDSAKDSTPFDEARTVGETRAQEKNPSGKKSDANVKKNNSLPKKSSDR